MKKTYLIHLLLLTIGLILIPLQIRSQNYWISDINQVKEINNTPVNTLGLNDIKFKNF